MDGMADAVHHQLELLLFSSDDSTRYYRFDKSLNAAYDDLDAASQTNIEALKNHAQVILEEQQVKFDALCEILKAADFKDT